MSVVSQELHGYVVLDIVEKSYTVQVPQVLIMVLVSLSYLRRIEFTSHLLGYLTISTVFEKSFN